MTEKRKNFITRLNLFVENSSIAYSNVLVEEAAGAKYRKNTTILFFLSVILQYVKEI